MSTQLALFTYPATQEDPRAELHAFQAGRCAGCGINIPLTARAARDKHRTRIGALVCHACSLRPDAVPAPTPVERATPLLRLRLTQGPYLPYLVPITDQDRQALATADWDHFANPVHALWAYQGGRCVLWTPRANAHATTRRASIVLDHDHRSGLLRGLICQSCNCTEGKGGRGALANAWRRYRNRPPAQEFPVTQGLTYKFATRWPRDTYNNHARTRPGNPGPGPALP